MPSVLDVCRAAKAAAPALARATTAQKNAALRAIADALDAAVDAIVEANAHDLETARAEGLSEGMLDRLTLDAAARAARSRTPCAQVVDLPDPVGEVVRGRRLPNGLELTQIRVPLGVVAMVYEGRPNVTVDAASLALKSGNACVLRGSSTAIHSNTVLAGLIRGACESAGLPADVVCLIEDTSRESVKELMRARGLVDLLIPRGGAGLIQAVVQRQPGAGRRDRRRQLPRLRRRGGRPRQGRCRSPSTPRRTASGSATPPRRCWSTRDVAEAFLPRVGTALREAGVRLRADADRAAAAGRRRAGHRRGLGHRVPRLRPRREGRRVPGRGARPHRPPRHAAHRGDRHRGPRRRAALHPRGRRRRRDRQRLDALHRRRRVRLRRRDRHRDPEAARPRPDGAAGADHHEVRVEGDGQVRA